MSQKFSDPSAPQMGEKKRWIKRKRWATLGQLPRFRLGRRSILGRNWKLAWARYERRPGADVCWEKSIARGMVGFGRKAGVSISYTCFQFKEKCRRSSPLEFKVAAGDGRICIFKPLPLPSSTVMLEGEVSTLFLKRQRYSHGSNQNLKPNLHEQSCQCFVSFWW